MSTLQTAPDAGSAPAVSPADADLLETVKRAAVELKRAGIPFALCGGWAVYARGGPRSEHDADFALLEQDVPRALDVLEEAGFSRGEAPEDWLAKVRDSGNLVDLIYRLSGEPVTPEVFDRVDQLEVGSVQMPVLAATDLVVTKLLTYRDHYCDFATSLPMVRALREQVDWPAVRERTARSPYAEAFLLLADRLGLTDREPG
ncbi:MAG: nucleotidyltransferase [Mycobacteriales bacterium]